MKHKRISILVAFCLFFMMIPACAIADDDISFSDVNAGDWYTEAVLYCKENGIMNGVTETRFGADEIMSRAMFVTTLYRIASSPAVLTAQTFDDVEAGSWYSDAVSWSVDTGLISGYGDGLFGTNDPISREQMAAILWRYAGSTRVQAEPFADQQLISDYALTAVDWARTSEIITGQDGNVFAPHEPATRAQVAVILHRYLTLAPGAVTNGDSNTLIVYFSRTGNTESLATYIQELTGGDLRELVAETPYPENYSDCMEQARQELRDDARPAFTALDINISDYDMVFIGYPIWHGQAPKIISTFLEKNDFSGQSIVPFCTSSSSGIGSSATNLHALCQDTVTWQDGRRFSSGASKSDIKEWLSSMGILSANSGNEDRFASKSAFNFQTKTVTLNSGYEMPINGIGTYSLLDEVCVNSVSEALASGVRLIDTAYMYHNEAAVGQAVRNSGIPREEIFVITKLYPNQFGNAESAINEALDKLDIGYIDLMLLHHPGAGDVEAYHAMERAVADGKIRSIGLSNWYVKELEEFLPQITITPALVQNEIHPYYQENDVIPYIQNLGIVVQGWYPLGGRGYTAELLGNEVITEIAAAHGVSSAQVILRWNLQKGVVVIPGSSNPDHIRENTQLYHFELSDEDMARINALDRREKHDWY